MDTSRKFPGLQFGVRLNQTAVTEMSLLKLYIFNLV